VAVTQRDNSQAMIFSTLLRKIGARVDVHQGNLGIPEAGRSRYRGQCRVNPKLPAPMKVILVMIVLQIESCKLSCFQSGIKSIAVHRPLINYITPI
jgi:hypothetical protein